MESYKCRNCGHEVILNKKPDNCECCNNRDFFIDYKVYTNLLVDKHKLENKIKSLEISKSKIEENRNLSVNDLQLKLNNLQEQNKKMRTLLTVSVIINLVFGILYLVA